MRILGEKDNLSGVRTALALGFFDGVHLGHRAVIDAVTARMADGLLPAAFTFGVANVAPDAKMGAGLIQTATLKTAALAEAGVRYLYWPQFEAIKTLSAERFVSDVIVGKLHAAVVACGADFRFGYRAGGGVDELRDMMRAQGGEVVVVPEVAVDGLPVSSTRIRAAIAGGDMALAARLLGRPFAVDFPVEQGRQLGRQMGLPTANQRFAEGVVHPRFGVYAARVTVGGKSYAAAANVGVKPTVGSDGVLCESYILDFDGDLYGQRIKTELMAFLRPEMRFDSIDQLREAIVRNARQARELLTS